MPLTLITGESGNEAGRFEADGGVHEVEVDECWKVEARFLMGLDWGCLEMVVAGGFVVGETALGESTVGGSEVGERAVGERGVLALRRLCGGDETAICWVQLCEFRESGVIRLSPGSGLQDRKSVV